MMEMKEMKMVDELLQFAVKDKKYLSVSSSGSRWYVKFCPKSNLAGVALLMIRCGEKFSVSDYSKSEEFDNFKDFKSKFIEVLNSDGISSRIKLMKKFYR
jgi:hypothetical protein